MKASDETFTDCACTVCGCVCDDLTFHCREGQLVGVDRACPLSEPWFARLSKSSPPVGRIEGHEVELAVALQRAAGILQASRNPLVFGLSRSSTPGQRAAVALAEQLGGNIDTTASVCHGPSIMAIQQVGESTSSLGEVRHRADLVIFWGANPAISHPRHFERYSLDAPGDFLPNGRSDRTLVVVDKRPTETSARADRFLRVAPGMDFELIWALRARLRGQELPAECDIGVSPDELQWLVDRLVSCRYGVVFFGLGLAQKGIGHANVEALLSLVADLNQHTRFTARRLRIPGDVTGADLVLCWQTGFPFAVNLARGYPRYNPGEYSANELLERGEVDACLLVGSEPVEDLSPAAREVLARIPTIALDYPHEQPAWTPTVQFTTAIYGVHAAGTAYRMDEVPIPLRCYLPSDYPTDEQILQAIAVAICDT